MAIKTGSGSNVRYTYTGDEKCFVPIESYMYFHHLGKYFVIPIYPKSVTDTMSIANTPTSILGRSAPIFTYSHSGPRSVSYKLTLHRDMLRQVNLTNSTIKTDDYIDELIKLIQSVTVPEYSDPAKMINPPVVTLRICDEIYIKGVIQGNVAITYEGPVLNTIMGKKYALASTTFTIQEFDPFSASQVARYGSYRGMDSTIDRNFYGYDGFATALTEEAARGNDGIIGTTPSTKSQLAWALAGA